MVVSDTGIKHRHLFRYAIPFRVDAGVNLQRTLARFVRSARPTGCWTGCRSEGRGPFRNA